MTNPKRAEPCEHTTADRMTDAGCVLCLRELLRDVESWLKRDLILKDLRDKVNRALEEDNAKLRAQLAAAQEDRDDQSALARADNGELWSVECMRARNERDTARLKLAAAQERERDLTEALREAEARKPIWDKIDAIARRLVDVDEKLRAASADAPAALPCSHDARDSHEGHCPHCAPAASHVIHYVPASYKPCACDAAQCPPDEWASDVGLVTCVPCLRKLAANPWAGPQLTAEDWDMLANVLEGTPPDEVVIIDAAWRSVVARVRACAKAAAGEGT